MSKKKSYLGLSFIILIFAVIFVPRIHDRIVNGSTVENSRMSNNKDKYEETATRAPGDMIVISKVPNYKFVNQENDTITQDYYKGKVYVAEFFFTSCSTICPVMNTNMQLVQDAFKNNNQVGIASFSIDPSYDRPEVLKEYAKSYNVSHPNWNFLTGDKKDIMKLSNEGFKLYAQQNEEAEDGFEHSGMFALIDKEGNVQSRIDENGNPLIYYNGLDEKTIVLLIEDINKLL